MSRRSVSLTLLSLVALVAAAFTPAAAGGNGTTAASGRPTVSRMLDGRAAPGAYVEGEVLVKFKSGVSATAIRGINARLGGRVIETLKAAKVARTSVSGDVMDAVARYSADPSVEYAEPNFIYHTFDTIPTDASFNQLWGLNNTGQSHGTSDGGPASGTPDADTDAPAAWDSGFGSGNVIVAVIDTGIDLNHPDLAGALWTNDDPVGGGDNDGNGYVDDLNGYDFVNNDAVPQDDNDHGSHVSGTIAGTENNGGIVGICPNCQIMALKSASNTGSLTTTDVVEAVDYAIDNGADIINGSFGGSAWSQTQRNAFNRANNAGILSVLAAGNSSLDNDLSICVNNECAPAYPASHRLSNILAVAATNHDDLMGFFTACEVSFGRNACFFTNWGRQAVDLGAPGVDILSSTFDDTYSYFNGTSMATPHVAGAAGLLLSNNPAYTAGQLKNALLNSVETPTSLDELWPIFTSTSPNGQNTLTSGRLNVFNSFSASTANNFPVTDGDINGAITIAQTKTGTLNFPADDNDVYKKTLQLNKIYRVILNGPDVAAKNVDIWVWKPGTTEIWQFTSACFTVPAGPTCKVKAAGLNGIGGAPGFDENFTFKANTAGTYYFHVTTWRNPSWNPGAGTYTLTVKLA